MCLCSFVCFVSFPWFNESKIHFFLFPNEPLSPLSQNVKKKNKNALFQVIGFHSERRAEKRNRPFSCPLVETFVRYHRYFLPQQTEHSNPSSPAVSVTLSHTKHNVVNGKFQK